MDNTNGIKLGSLIIYPKDADKKMRWKAALEYAEKTGGGWRLPSLEELKLMYSEFKKNNDLKFEKFYYWAADEVSTRDAIAFDFKSGSHHNDTKTYQSFVRLVKDAEENESSEESSEPSASICKKVNKILKSIISLNSADISADEDFKIDCKYGYAKFYLGKLDGSYDMSIYGLVHYIMFEEKMYSIFLTANQLKSLKKMVKEFPEGIYGPNSEDENYEFVQYEVLDVIYSSAIKFVSMELERFGHDISVFKNYFSE
jgi:hypothetical protein